MKPLPIEPGDTIAVIAPASVPRDMSKFHAGVEKLRSRGYNVELGRAGYRRHGYLCGSDEERLTELNDFLRRPDVKMIVAARGGYGVLRILDQVDYAAAARYPKLVVGYSDITALHFSLYKHSGLPGLSGPMVAVEWHDPDPASEDLFWELARGGTPSSLIGPRGEALTALRPGSAEGVLLGGNLAMVVRLIGTPYLPSLEGAILFLEDVGEEPYRIDAMLAQLKLAGILDRLGGLIFGAFTDWQPEEGTPTLSLDEVVGDYARRLSIPVARGLVYGHFPVKNTIPVGVRARLEVTSDGASLAVLEPVVSR
ncbi:MAG: LD-carboxypeptidase [Rhodothermales bacterium]